MNKYISIFTITFIVMNAFSAKAGQQIPEWCADVTSSSKEEILSKLSNFKQQFTAHIFCLSKDCSVSLYNGGDQLATDTKENIRLCIRQRAYIPSQSTDCNFSVDETTVLLGEHFAVVFDKSSSNQNNIFTCEEFSGSREWIDIDGQTYERFYRKDIRITVHKKL